MKKLQETFQNLENKTDINIPSDPQYLKGFTEWGTPNYDWPPKLGFQEETIQGITRESGLQRHGIAMVTWVVGISQMYPHQAPIPTASAPSLILKIQMPTTPVRLTRVPTLIKLMPLKMET